jgi:drug/metabolite transporter superfamily protein YnfA
MDPARHWQDGPVSAGTLSILWGWRVDGVRPDRPEIAGAFICLVGVAVIMYWPRI